MAKCNQDSITTSPEFSADAALTAEEQAFLLKEDKTSKRGLTSMSLQLSALV